MDENLITSANPNTSLGQSHVKGQTPHLPHKSFLEDQHFVKLGKKWMQEEAWNKCKKKHIHLWEKRGKDEISLIDK